MDVTEILADLAEKRAYLTERLEEEPIPYGDAATVAVREEIQRLGLERHLLALDTDGYVVLTPEELNSGDLLDRLNATIDRLVGEQQKAKGIPDSFGEAQVLMHTVPEDPVFQEVLLQPKPLALLTYLLGYHAKLNQSTVLLKPKEAPPLLFHADTGGKFPMPWPETAQVANVTWMLSDYTFEGGTLCVVPGSHLLGNPPLNLPPLAWDHPSVVPIEAPAGSVIIWHGGLLHGSCPRTIEGLRRTLILYYSRAYIESQELYKLTTTMEMLERNPARFGVLMGVSDRIPWGPNGPDSADPTVVTGITRFD